MAIHRTADTAKSVKATVIELAIRQVFLNDESPYSLFSPINDRIDDILLFRYAVFHLSTVRSVVVVKELLHIRSRRERKSVSFKFRAF